MVFYLHVHLAAPACHCFVFKTPAVWFRSGDVHVCQSATHVLLTYSQLDEM